MRAHRMRAVLRSAFPGIVSVTTSHSSTESTTFPFLMPAAVDPGDLLLMVVAYDEYNITINTPSGWTLISTQSGTIHSFRVFAKVADGTEGGTSVSVTTTTVVEDKLSSVLRIRNFFGEISSGIAEAFSHTTTTTNPDPPGLTAPWGVAKNLWLAITTKGGASVISYPSNYGLSKSNNDLVVPGIVLAAREREAATENPGSFTLSASVGAVYGTIAVRGT